MTKSKLVETCIPCKTSIASLVSRSRKRLLRPNGHRTFAGEKRRGHESVISREFLNKRAGAGRHYDLLPSFRASTHSLLDQRCFCIFFYFWEVFFLSPSRPFDCLGRLLVPFLRFGMVQSSCSMMPFGGFSTREVEGLCPFTLQ